jgi:iron(III) transport system permease protein
MKQKLTLLFVLIIFFLPLAIVLFQVLDGLIENSGALSYFITSQFFSKIYNSIILCLGVGIFSVLLAIASTVSFFSLKQTWKRKFLILILFMLFSISPIIYLSALTKLLWFSHLSIYIQSVFVLSVKLFPLATIILIFSFSRISMPSINTAIMISAFKNMFRYIIVPQLYKPMISSFLIIFMLTFVHQEIPSYLGYRTYAEEFFSRIVVMDHIKDIAYMTLPFIILSFLTLIILMKTFKHHIDNKKNSFTYVLFNFHRSTVFTMSLLIIFIIYMNFLLIKELNIVDFKSLLSDNFSAFENSFFLSFCTGILATIISVVIYPLIYNNNSSIFKIIVTSLMLLYWLLPSAMSSLSLIELSTYLNGYGISSGYFLILFAYIIKVIPIALLLLASFETNQSSDIFLKLRNVKNIDILKYITIPLNWTKWLVLVVILTVFSLNELSSTVLLIPPGEETIIVKIYNLMHYGDFASVAFLSLLQMILILLSVVLLGTLLRRKYDYT